MTMQIYATGYGRQEPIPDCIEPIETIDCPCCEGHGEHTYGDGMNSMVKECELCGGHSMLVVRRMTNADWRNWSRDKYHELF